MDELLPYYNRELAFFRRMSQEFAETNPKVAGRLKLGPDASEDPHVERLIEAFALLNARTRHKLDDDFPEISDSLLNVLHPSLLAPIPSMSIAELTLDESQAADGGGHRIARGSTVETEPIEGEPCYFRTAFDVDLFPIELIDCKLSGLPLRAPQTSRSDNASAALQLTLQTYDGELPFSELELSKLRFFLNGPPQLVNPLYELLLNNALQIALAESPDDRDPIVLGGDAIQAGGLEPDERLLPANPRAPAAHSLLLEFMTFPTKFMFLDIHGLEGRLSKLGSTLELFIYLNRTSIDLEQNVSKNTLRLGCTPIVNLYTQRADPIQASQAVWRHRVVGDARRPLSTEIYSVDRVVGSNNDGEEVEFQPFYSAKHDGDLGRKVFWASSRESAGNDPDGEQEDDGSEVYLSLIDINNSPGLDADWYVDVETTCLNRDLPNRLPFGVDQPALTMPDAAVPLAVRCLTPPTPTRRPPRKHGAVWRLISHLSVNHLSLIEGDKGAHALIELLKLYDLNDTPETRELIESILSIDSRRVIGRTRDGVCRGVEVQLEFRAEQFSENGLFVFASVLERFLASYCSLNSFSQLAISVRGREGVLRRWQPRSGTRVLL